MIHFATISGDIGTKALNALRELIDLEDPLADDRWDKMRRIELFELDGIVFKIIFCISEKTFDTLYEIMTYILTLDISNDIIIQVINISMPEPPTHPTLYIEKFFFKSDKCKDLYQLPKEPESFIKMYNYEDSIKKYFSDKNKSCKYAFTDNLYDKEVNYNDHLAVRSHHFNSLKIAITYAVYIYFNNNLHMQNLSDDVIEKFKADILLDVYTSSQGEFILHDYNEIKEKIYTYLLSIPEWVEFIDSWKSFWTPFRTVDDRPNFEDLYSTFNIPILKI
jgi:hypothetical protein